MYLYNIETNYFEKLNDVPFIFFSAHAYIHNNNLIIFGGVKEDRISPNMDIWRCKFIDDNMNIIKNPEWFNDNTFIDGSCHSTFIEALPKNNNNLYYFNGCDCHACLYCVNMETGLYTHDKFRKYRINFNDNNIETTQISSPMFQVSHAESSSFYHNNMIYIIGGQTNNDHIFEGVQLYLIDLDIWIEIKVDQQYKQYFNKGCISFIHNNKLYLVAGQYCNEYKKCIGKFNDMLMIFELK